MKKIFFTLLFAGNLLAGEKVAETKVLATIDGKPITIAEFQANLGRVFKSRPLKDQGRRFKFFIQEQILKTWAEKNKIKEKPEFKQKLDELLAQFGGADLKKDAKNLEQLKKSLETLVINVLLIEELKKEITDKDLQKYVNEHKDQLKEQVAANKLNEKIESLKTEYNVDEAGAKEIFGN